jgi:glycosyltransferase involved in cell wall biosynthesis
MEIILVDNGSTDNTLNIAKNFNINIIVDESKTIGGLRNLGVQASKGEILGFIDADCTVSSDWMIRADYILRDKQIGITGSRLKTSNEGNWVEEAWALHLNSRVQQDGIVKYINSGNCVLRREVFDVVGGFSETLVTDEDVDLCEKVRALGYCIYHCEDITAIHWGYPKTIRQFFKREIWHGIGDSKRNIVSFWKSRPLLISFFNILLLILALISLVIRSALLLLFLTFLLILP